MTDASRKTARTLPLALIPLALLFLGFMLAGKLLDPPAVRAQAEAGKFDANAARERLARVLGDETAHPVDSAAQDVVREALLREITALGLQPEVRDAFTCRPQPRGPLVDCARVRNIVFSIGPTEGPAILAAAHYDTVAASPGASDDGIGLAVWLEIARLLRDEQLTRRVIFLFSDGEEPALLGAYSFASDPLMRSAEALVNLEARGSRGPAIFFETNQPNADAVAAFAAAPRGVANSVAADVYALLSNSSDVTALTRPDLDVLNIALLDGLGAYHTPQDVIASQDPRSVQHMGDIALAVTRALAGAPDRGGTTPMVYTDIASYAFVSMPAWAAQAVLGLCVVVAAFVFWRTSAEGRWRAFAAPLLGIVFACLLAAIAGFALGLIRPGAQHGLAFPEPARAWCILAALLGTILALMVLRVRRDAVQLGAAGVLWFASIGFALSFVLNGISILFVIPAAAFTVFALIGFIWRPALLVGAASSAMVLALVVWAPVLFLTELALGFEFPFATAILFAIPTLVWFGAFVRAQGAGRWRGVAIVLGIAAIACVVASALAPSANVARPQPLNINYFFNTASGEAHITAGAATRALPRELAASFEPEVLLPGDIQDTWVAPARAVTFPAPTLEGIRITAERGERVVRGRLRMNGAYRALIRMPNEARPLRAVVSGAPADFSETGGTGDHMTLACQGRACDGADVAIHLEAAGEARDWHLIGQFPGAAVPAEVQAIRARRPASATPIQLGDGAVTLSRLRPIP